MNDVSVDIGKRNWQAQEQDQAKVRGRTALATYRVIHGFGLWPRVEGLLGAKQAKELLVSCEQEWLDLEHHLRIVEHALVTSDRTTLVEIGGAIGCQWLGEACRYRVLQKASTLVGPMAQLFIVQAPLIWTGAFRGAGTLAIEQVGMRQAILAIDGAPRVLALSNIWHTIMEGVIGWAMGVVGAKARLRIFAEPRESSIVMQVRWERLAHSRPSITAM